MPSMDVCDNRFQQIITIDFIITYNRKKTNRICKNISQSCRNLYSGQILQTSKKYENTMDNSGNL